MYLAYTICSRYHNTAKVAYCAPTQYAPSTIMEAYCVGKVHNMLPRLHYDNGSILCW